MSFRQRHASRPALYAPLLARAFTLMELILVMAVLAIAISITAPALARFFRGRTLDSEARRLLSMTRQAQSRAVSEGIPVELWVDAAHQSYGFEAEPTFETTDPKAASVQMDSDMQILAIALNTPESAANQAVSTSPTSVTPSPKSNHPTLPRIRFLPDGSIAESSPQMIQLTGRDGSLRWIALARNRLTYEIRAQAQ